jgi:uncharacterized membrane protein
MTKTRLESFSDGVLAILITIMVIELKVPAGTDWAALSPTISTLGSYTLSFVYLAIYWGNHHHLLHTAGRVNGKIIWANMHLLFWLSLVPFATSWVGGARFDSISVAVYGGLLVLCAVAYTILAQAIAKYNPERTKFSEALHKGDVKGKFSAALYLASVPLAFVHPLISCAIFVFVAVIWIVPNKDVEKVLGE